MFRIFQTLQDSLSAGPDRIALADIDHRVHTATRAHFEARRALAVAMAERAREFDRMGALGDRIVDLESRAVASIAGGRRDLATSAAETIAILEAEQGAAREASVLYDVEIAKLRAAVEAQRRRLADLDRGRRLARVSAALGAASTRAGLDPDCLSEAETALTTLRERQADDAAIRAALAPPEISLVETMADAGFGKQLRPRMSDILARIEAKACLPAPGDAQTSA